ncbi:TasA family protein [Pseudonocardia halophobica]|uniref:TasA family protein n=1 Tax=Pseudonocardia halophobica TaxID=29401 RepID=UPI003D8F62D6
MRTAGNRKTAVAVGAAAAAAAALALGSGTYAAFTDSEAGPAGTLSAGTLRLDLTTNPSQTATILTESGIAPGKQLSPSTITLHNSGSLPGLLTVTGTADGHGGQLQDQLTVSYTCVSDNPAHLPVVVGEQTLATALSAVNVPLDSGERLVCSFRFTLPHRPDNNLVQGDSVTVTSSFTLSQRSS